MLRITYLAALAAIVFAVGCAHCPDRPRVAAVDSDALSAVQTYEHGESREALVVVEGMVRDAANGPDGGAALAAELASQLHVPGTTHDAKLFICRQLWIVGTENEVDALAPLLTNPKTTDMARYALEGIPGAAVDAALLEALPRTSGAAKAGIISTLGNRRAGSARGALEPLTTNSDPVIAAAAISALHQLGN